MDPLTHFLFGGCMSRAGLNRKTGLATLTMVLAAEAADIDVVWAAKGPIAALQHHRGITHSFVGAPLVAAATVAFVFLLHRVWLERRRNSQAIPVRWMYVYWFALLAALSHILLDYTTAYGIRMFAPFDWRWYSWDIVSIFEPLMLVVLVLGLVMPALFGLINQEIGAKTRGPRGRGWAVFALVCVVVLWGFRDYQHRRALNAMNAITYQQEIPARAAAYPYPLNPFSWHGVVETRDFFQTVPVDSRVPEIDRGNEAQTFYKPEETDVTRAAKASYFGSVYLDWAVFPIVQTQTVQEESRTYLVHFEDLRYKYPGLRDSRLDGYVVIGDGLRVMYEGRHPDEYLEQARR